MIKLSNWLRSHHSHDLEHIQLEVAGEVFLYTLIFSIWNFNTFSIPKGHFGQIQYFFKVLKTDFEIQYFFNTFNTAWEPCKPSAPHGQDIKIKTCIRII